MNNCFQQGFVHGQNLVQANYYEHGEGILEGKYSTLEDFESQIKEICLEELKEYKNGINAAINFEIEVIRNNLKLKTLGDLMEDCLNW